MKPRARTARDGMLPEYEFDYSSAVRGKHYRQLIKEGAHVVVVDPDIAKAFRTSEAVNAALRSLLEMTETTRRSTSRSGRRPRVQRTSGDSFGEAPV